MIYLDSAATTLHKPKRVYENAQWAMRNLSSPGRGQYLPAEKAAEVVYNCREKAAKLFNVKNSDNVVFTFNATHGLNIAINTLAYKGCKVVVSGYEHNAVMRPLRYVGADIDVVRSPLFDSESAINAFKYHINSETDFVVCTTISNVFGFILPIYEIAMICKERNVPLIIDASQGAGVMDLDFEKLGAEFMAMPGHKGLYGPQGTGILLCSCPIKPLITGGTGSASNLELMPEYLPDSGEAGTHNVSGIAGLSAGIDYVLGTTPGVILKHEQKLLRICVEELRKIRDIRMYEADDKNCQGGVLSFTACGIDPVLLGNKLSEKGVCVRAGLHCAPEAHKTVGTLDSGTVRMSVSAFTRKTEVFEFCKILNSIIK